MADKPDQNEHVIGQFSRQAESYGKLTAGLASEERRKAFAALIGAMPNDIALDVCRGPEHWRWTSLLTLGA